jgi:hypothetical protein
VGRTAGSIIDIGATERPPDSEASVPISVTRSPEAPALAMPYMGLCGLFCVSLSERVQITQPFTLARVATEVFEMIPRRNALSAWKVEAQLAVQLRGSVGSMLSGRPSFS